jgi:hypothetical protein
MYTSGSCAAGFKSFYPGSRLVYSLYLGASVPVGGTLTVTTCGHTSNDTVLYVGTGCPTWAAPFGCLVGSDDAMPPAGPCGSNAAASTVSLTAAQRTYFIQAGGVNGAAVTTGLGWAYAAPSGSRSGSRTASRTRTSTRSRTRSASRSRTRKPK